MHCHAPRGRAPLLTRTPPTTTAVAGFGVGLPAGCPFGSEQPSVRRRLGLGFATRRKFAYTIVAVAGSRVTAPPPSVLLAQARETTPSTGLVSATARCWAANPDVGSGATSSTYAPGSKPRGIANDRWNAPAARLSDPDQTCSAARRRCRSSFTASSTLPFNASAPR